MTEGQLIKLRTDLRNVDQDNIEVEGLSHVALLNIQRRIISYFGVEYGLEIQSALGKGIKVTVRLPLRRRGI